MTPPQMRAITIKAPWTVPILLGIKGVENRRQATRYRGPLAIHVSRTWCPVGAAVLDGYTAARGGNRASVANLALTRGHIVAVCELVDCHRDAGCCRPWGEPGVWHLILRHVRPLRRPVPARGALGIWTPAPELVAAITAGLGGG